MTRYVEIRGMRLRLPEPVDPAAPFKLAITVANLEGGVSFMTRCATCGRIANEESPEYKSRTIDVTCPSCGWMCEVPQ